MTWWRTGAGVLASALLVLSAPVTHPVAAAQPIGQPVSPAPGATSLMELEIDELAPRVVTAADQNVTVTGRVTNTGDQRIDDIRVRLQRGEALQSDRAVRDAENQATDSGSSPFQNVSKSLEPGASVQVSMTIPVGGTDRSLRITQPGVYPLLVNVNGRPDFGEQARLAAVSIQLPVLSVAGGTSATPRSSPSGLTVLWPLLDEKPRRLPTTDGNTLLADDELADSLTVGGRLFSLVNAVQAVSTNSELVRSLCFAVDPDLLETVSAMREGYQVRQPDGQVVPGKGAEAAADWLARVQDLARGHCVIAVPYADADLVALSRSGAVDLAQLSIASSPVVTDLLGSAQPAKELYWPAGGSFDQRTLVDLSSLGPATLLADAEHLQNVSGQPPYSVTGAQTAHPIRAFPVDSLVSDALATPSTTPARPQGAPEVISQDAVSVQNGLAALTYRLAFDEHPPGHVLVAPPRRWNAPRAELDLFLSRTAQLFDDGFAEPVSLLDEVADADGGTASGLGYTAEDSAKEIPTQITAEVMRINATKRDLLTAMGDDTTSQIDPNMLLAPMQYGLLRAVSTAWRGRTDQAVGVVEYVDAQLDGLRGQVVVTNPGRPLSLASGESPIPIKIDNGLPVAIVVRINLAPVTGLRPDAYPDIQVPPLSSISRYIPAEVSRSGRFTLDVRLSTPNGTPLGETVRLELNSTSYGIITVAVTGIAGAVLVLLVGIRIFRRVKAARAGAPNAEGTGDA